MKILAIGHSIAHYRQRAMWKWIADQGHKVDTVVPPSYANEVYKGIKQGSFQQHLVPTYTSNNNNFWFFPAIHDVIAGLKPDIIFCVQEPWTYVAYHTLKIAQSFRIPFGFFTWENIPKPWPVPWRPWESAVITESDLAVGGNQDAVEILLLKGANGVAKLLQTGIDPNMMFPEPELKFSEREGPKKILFAGRLTAAKGIDVILKAFDKLPENEYVLRFVGGRGELEHLIREHPKFGKEITLEPWAEYERMSGIYNWADVSLMPSIDQPMWIEQCGYAVGESLMCHTPVITSFSKSIAELWKAPGVTFIPQKDVDMLADHLMMDSTYDAEKAKAGRQFVIDNYSVEKIGEKYIEAFEETI
jgi:glycosyltransferase involved in cell wall biosynthesis